MALTNDIIEQIEKHGFYTANRSVHPNFAATVAIIDGLEAEGKVTVERHRESQTGKREIDFVRARRRKS